MVRSELNSPLNQTPQRVDGVVVSVLIFSVYCVLIVSDFYGGGVDGFVRGDREKEIESVL